MVSVESAFDFDAAIDRMLKQTNNLFCRIVHIHSNHLVFALARKCEKFFGKIAGALCSFDNNIDMPVEIAIYHRTGTVAIGEPSVVIAVSAPHRQDALAACKDAIDTLKERVPLWKKEIYQGGEEWIGRGS